MGFSAAEERELKWVLRRTRKFVPVDRTCTKEDFEDILNAVIECVHSRYKRS